MGIFDSLARYKIKNKNKKSSFGQSQNNILLFSPLDCLLIEVSRVKLGTIMRSKRCLQ
jgi:hypothetical protein